MYATSADAETIADIEITSIKNTNARANANNIIDADLLSFLTLSFVSPFPIVLTNRMLDYLNMSYYFLLMKEKGVGSKIYKVNNPLPFN